MDLGIGGGKTSMKDKVFIDSNVLVYAHDIASPAKQKMAKEAVYEAIRSDRGAISTQVISEFYITITRKIKSPLSVPEARREIELLSVLEIVEIDLTMIFSAIRFQSRWKISYWDGLILAAAEQAQCAFLLSEDMKDQENYDGIVVHNPFGL